MSKNHEDVDALRDALFGRSVVSVAMADGEETVEGEVRLDDGTILELAGNVGGCICSAGDYELTALADMPINGITNVEVDVEGEPDEYGEGPQRYRIFVLAFGGKFELARFDGDDGNGYYGTGFWFNVKKSA